MLTPMFPNRLAKERAGRGLTRQQVAEQAEIDPRLYAEFEAGRMLPRHGELQRIRAVLGGVEAIQLFDYSIVNTIGDDRFWGEKLDYKRFYESMTRGARLLVSPDETLWLDRDVEPDRAVDVFLNMSCGTQHVPHLMLDAAAVFKALGVSFTAGAGQAYCCGTYFRRFGNLEGTDRMSASSVKRNLKWGASTVVHICTQCVNTFNEVQRRQRYEAGDDQSGLEHTQLLRFLDQRLTELGDRVPWKREVQVKVLGHGHSAYSWVHDRAKLDVAAVARHIPGVEFVGFLDTIPLDGLCDTDPTTPTLPEPKTRAEVDALRDELAAIVASRGADTVSPQHQGCLMRWSRFSSRRADVRHIVSILAEALGVGHPDRYKAASRLGHTPAVVEQTRPIWSAWGMSEETATQTARSLFDPAYSVVGQCACGKDGARRCGHDNLISVDILTGTTTR